MDILFIILGPVSSCLDNFDGEFFALVFEVDCLNLYQIFDFLEG